MVFTIANRSASDARLERVSNVQNAVSTPALALQRKEGCSVPALARRLTGAWAGPCVALVHLLLVLVGEQLDLRRAIVHASGPSPQPLPDARLPASTVWEPLSHGRGSPAAPGPSRHAAQRTSRSRHGRRRGAGGCAAASRGVRGSWLAVARRRAGRGGRGGGGAAMAEVPGPEELSAAAWTPPARTHRQGMHTGDGEHRYCISLVDQPWGHCSYAGATI